MVSIGPSTIATNRYSLTLTWTASDATSLASFALLQPVSAMANHVRVYREAQGEGHAPLTRVKNDRVGASRIRPCGWENACQYPEVCRCER